MSAILRFPAELSTVPNLLREASADTRRWRCVLRGIASAVPGAEGEIAFVPAAGPRLQTAFGRTRVRFGTGAANDLPPEAVPFAGLAQGAAEARSAVAALDLLPLRAGRWRLLLRPHGPRCAVGESEALRILRRALVQLAPDLREAFSLSHELACQRIPARARLEAAWDPLDTGVLLCDGELRPIFINAAAEHHLATRWLFRTPGRRSALRLHAVGAALALEGIVDDVVQRRAPSGRVVVPARGDGAAVELRVARFGDDALDWPTMRTPRSRPKLLAVTLRAAPAAANAIARERGEAAAAQRPPASMTQPHPKT